MLNNLSVIKYTTILSNSLSLYSSLNVRDQVLHPYKTTDKIIVLYMSITGKYVPKIIAFNPLMEVRGVWYNGIGNSLELISDLSKNVSKGIARNHGKSETLCEFRRV
jgi:hypothetical protein